VDGAFNRRGVVAECRRPETATIAAPTVVAAATSAKPGSAEAERWSRKPAPTNPSGPVADIAVVADAITRARRRGGAQSVRSAKNRGKKSPEHTPFAAMPSAIAHAGTGASRGQVVAAIAIMANAGVRVLTDRAREEISPPATDRAPYDARSHPASRALAWNRRRATTGSVANSAVIPISTTAIPTTVRSRRRSRLRNRNPSRAPRWPSSSAVPAVAAVAGTNDATRANAARYEQRDQDAADRRPDEARRLVDRPQQGASSRQAHLVLPHQLDQHQLLGRLIRGEESANREPHRHDHRERQHASPVQRRDDRHERPADKV